MSKYEEQKKKKDAGPLPFSTIREGVDKVYINTNQGYTTIKHEELTTGNNGASLLSLVSQIVSHFIIKKNIPIYDEVGGGIVGNVTSLSISHLDDNAILHWTINWNIPSHKSLEEIGIMVGGSNDFTLVLKK